MASSYAGDASVVGVIGPWSSRCAAQQIPITNRAGLSLLSPSSTYVGLTHGGAGAARGDPGRLYPQSTRTFARLMAADDMQGAADAMLADKLGLRRLFVLHDPYDYGKGLAGSFDKAARRLDIRDTDAIARRVRAARPDGVFLAGGVDEFGGGLVRSLHRIVPHAQLIGADGFAGDSLPRLAGAAAEGMMDTFAGIPPERLPDPGQRFAHRFGHSVGAAPDIYSIYNAAAADVMADALARSDGTRTGVRQALFATRRTDSLLGDLAFTPDGDISAPAISVYQVRDGRQRLLDVLTPPRELLR
jgi:branched-chain amino acid transport system substrate-binding protein